MPTVRAFARLQDNASFSRFFYLKCSKQLSVPSCVVTHCLGSQDLLLLYQQGVKNVSRWMIEGFTLLFQKKIWLVANMVKILSLSCVGSRRSPMFEDLNLDIRKNLTVVEDLARDLISGKNLINSNRGQGFYHKSKKKSALRTTNDISLQFYKNFGLVKM